MNDVVAIAPLTNVTLRIERCDEDGTPLIQGSPFNFVFVFGIATEGLTTFEKALIDKVSGDQIHIRIEPSQMALFFDYLAGPLTTALGANPPFALDVRVVTVSPVSDKELVHALARKAEAAGCGCSGGCGC